MAHSFGVKLPSSAPISRQVVSIVRGSALRSRVLSLAKTCSIGLRSGDGLAFVTAQIVHDDDISGGEGGNQELLDVGPETDAVDRPVDDAGRLDPVAAQGGQEGQRVPAAVRHLGNQARPTPRASVAAGHVGLGPGLVDEDQAPGIKPALILLPPGAPSGDVGPILLAGVQAFFLKLMPSCSKKCQTA